MGVREARRESQAGPFPSTHPGSIPTEYDGQLKQKTRNLTEQPDTMLLTRLRAVESKMGLILTLVSMESLQPVSVSMCHVFSSRHLYGV